MQPWLPFNAIDDKDAEAAMKVREVIRMLERDGWRLDRQSGSHRQFRHPTKPGTVTVAGKLGAELAPGTLASVFRQADRKRHHR